MPAQSTGPLYGPLPEIDVAWTIDDDQGGVLFDGEDVRELLREMNGIRVNKYELHKLTLAMNAAAAISAKAVAKLQQKITTILSLELKIQAVKQRDIENPDELPLVQADVVHYSEEPLKKGVTAAAMKLQPLIEEVARLKMEICIGLALMEHGLPGPCCPDHSVITRNPTTTSLYRG